MHTIPYQRSRLSLEPPLASARLPQPCWLPRAVAKSAHRRVLRGDQPLSGGLGVSPNLISPRRGVSTAAVSARNFENSVDCTYGADHQHRLERLMVHVF
jgi:hypothetical protein